MGGFFQLLFFPKDNFKARWQKHCDAEFAKFIAKAQAEAEEEEGPGKKLSRGQIEELLAYSGTPLTWTCKTGRKVERGCLDDKYFSMKFRTKKEIWDFAIKHHDKWEPGLMFQFKGKIAVAGWIAY